MILNHRMAERRQKIKETMKYDETGIEYTTFSFTGILSTLMSKAV